MEVIGLQPFVNLHCSRGAQNPERHVSYVTEL